MSQETILPDCQMPDGAEPCKGYLQLQETAIQIAGDKHALKDQVRALRARVARMVYAFDQMRICALPPHDISGKRMWDEAMLIRNESPRQSVAEIEARGDVS